MNIRGARSASWMEQGVRDDSTDAMSYIITPSSTTAVYICIEHVDMKREL